MYDACPRVLSTFSSVWESAALSSIFVYLRILCVLYRVNDFGKVSWKITLLYELRGFLPHEAISIKWIIYSKIIEFCARNVIEIFR